MTAVVTVDPDAVCVNVIVVTGIATWAVGDRVGRGPRPFPFVSVAVSVTVVGGIGTRVTELGMPVQIPGFWGTKSAQTPARYDSAAVISSVEEPHAETQD